MLFKKAHTKKDYLVNIFFYFFIFFSIYCSLILGKSFDENYQKLQGIITFNYLFSFGSNKHEVFTNDPLTKFYSSIYWTIQYFISLFFPQKYSVYIHHILNLLVSFSGAYGFFKLGKELFNKEIGKIFFGLLFIYPIFFGHVSINPKDTILLFCHVWIFYLLIRYLKTQKGDKSKINFPIILSVLFSIGTGIQYLFIGSLLPLLLFVLVDIYFVKKFVNNKFNKYIFLRDFSLFIVFSFFLLILFNPFLHENFFLSLKFIVNSIFQAQRGHEFNLLAGNIYYSKNLPNYYFYLSFFFKSPEFLLFNYLIFLLFFKSFISFFKKKIKFFYYKIILIIIYILFPLFLFTLLPFGAYDGIRLFLWVIPYFLIIPSLVIYYLIKNLLYLKFKLLFYINLFLILYYLLAFISITPYQYTYLNSFSSHFKDNSEMFENDYWSVSIKELVKKINNVQNGEDYEITTCGINRDILKEYLSLYKIKKNFKFVPLKEAKYIIMNNRVVSDIGNNQTSKPIDTCYNKHNGKDVVVVKRLNMKLSVLRKLEH